MLVKYISILLTLLLLQVSCTSGDPRISGPDGDAEIDNPVLDGDSEIDADNDPDSVVDGDDEGQPDGDSEATACVTGQTGCAGSLLTVCQDAEWHTIADCNENGWICESGQCAASGEETETETAYRDRLNELRIANAGLKVLLDPYGGWMNAPDFFGEPDPDEYFRVKKINGRWWFITPDGHPLVSKGVTDVNYLGATLQDDDFHQILVDKYGNENAWVDASLDRLHGWGFNSIGPWSSRSILDRNTYAEPILNSGMWAPRYNVRDPVADYWSQGFEDHAYAVGISGAAPFSEDKNLLGFFLDNELVWGPDWRTDKTLIQLYVDFPEEALGRVEVLRFVKEASVDLNTFNTTWGTALASWDDLPSLTSYNFKPGTTEAESVTEDFMVHAFHRYATIAVAGLRAIETNHLILGCRFAWYPGDAMIRASAQYFDVISMAGYHENWVDEIGAIHEEVDKPFFTEEFAFKAKDSCLLNVKNYAPVVDTQKDRALAYADYVETLMRQPWALGYHWYKWFDNPKVEDDILSGDNFGLMNYRDEPYTDFITFIREVNFQVETWHAEGLPGDGVEVQE
jgi:agarase